MTKEASDLPHGLITPQDLRIELERLSTHFPRTDMNPAKWVLLAQDFWEDCQHLTVEQLRTLCRAYRSKPENRFFPTPGQLLEATHHPFEDVYITPEREYYRALPAPELSPEEFERRCQVLRDLADKLSTQKQRRAPDEIPDIVMTPELEQRERDLREVRQGNLERRLALVEEERELGRDIGLNR